MRDSKGRFIRTSEDIQVECLCGDSFFTTTARVTQGRGKFCSKACSYKYRNTPAKYSKYTKRSENPGWFKTGEFRPDTLYKKDRNAYVRLHNWINRKRQKSGVCEECRMESKTQWANISREYHKDLTDWVELCPKCHKAYDLLGKELSCLV